MPGGFTGRPGGIRYNYPLIVSMQDPVNKAPIAWNWNSRFSGSYLGL